MLRTFLTVAVLLTITRVASGQGFPATLRGSVVTMTGEPVPYALVRLLPAPGQRFTDQRGHFAFAALAPGDYRLEVRQVGFEPRDTSVTVSSTDATVRVALRALAELFAQVLENARRYSVLADSYPFIYRMQRTFLGYGEPQVVVWSARDTVEYASNGRVRYRPGEVVRWGTGPQGRRERVLDLPTLADLADGAFHANHCFYLEGLVEQDGQRFVRLAFLAAEALRTPDIEGEVDLDPTSYQIRRATIRLTRPGRAAPDLAAATSTMVFRELYPNIVVPERVNGVVVPTLERRSTGRAARTVDEQRLIDVRFVRALPDSAGPRP